MNRHAPPYAFATKPDTWQGVDFKDIIEAMEEEGDFSQSDLEHLINNGLEEHHEDAIEDVVDLDELFEAVGTWSKNREQNPAHHDDHLNAFLIAWNQKQNITSYYLDFSQVVATNGASKDEMVNWLRHHIKALEFENAMPSSIAACRRPFLSGGCYEFALALAEEFPDSQFVGIGSPDFPEHVGIRIGDYFVDVRGVLNEEDFRAHLKGDINILTQDQVALHCGLAGVEPPYIGNDDVNVARAGLENIIPEIEADLEITGANMAP